MFLISLCTFLCIVVLFIGKSTQYSLGGQVSGFDGKWKFVIDNRIFLLFALVLICVSTLRYGWIDTYTYKEMYIASRGDLQYVNSAPYGVEAGWLYLCYFLNFISASPKLLLFVSAVIIIGGYVTIIKRYSCDPIFSLIIFFCILYMDTNNGLRQMVAASLIILVFPLLSEKKIWKYVIYAFVVLIAMQLHASAVICLVIAFVIIGKPFNIKIKLAILFGVIFTLAPSLVNNVLAELFSDSKYALYLDVSAGMTFSRAFVTGIFPAILTFFYLRKCKKCNIEIEYTEGLLINLLFVNSLFIIMGCYMQYWNRMGFYTAFAPIVLMPKLAYSMFVKDQRRIVKILAIFLYFLFFAYNIYVNIGYGAMDDFYISLFN